MRKIAPNLFIGSDSDCPRLGSAKIAIIHACRTCYESEVFCKGSSEVPSPFVFHRGNHLYLNMVDREREMMSPVMNPMVRASLKFIKKYIKEKEILVHCNFGISRSPTLGLIYLAQRGIISRDSYQNASRDFQMLYPEYHPGAGIRIYMKKHWKNLLLFRD